MNAQNLQSDEDGIVELKKNSSGKFGLICLNCLINKIRFKEIVDFLEQNNISLPERILTKHEYLNYIANAIIKNYKLDSELKDYYEDPLEYLGELLTKDKKIKDYLRYFDFIAKQDLKDSFADYCADMGISVYDCTDLSDCSEDLYLIKKKPLLKTEAVFLRTGIEMDIDSYLNTLELIKNASKIAMWLVFVTTPYGVRKIGLKKIINDMIELRTWFYVVDPVHKKVLGISKGKKSKQLEDDLRDNYIRKLPHEPIRTPSQLVNISNYYFKESESYKPKTFQMYKIFEYEEFLKDDHIIVASPKFREIYRNLIIIDKMSGLPVLAFPSESSRIDQALISGFLTAMDNFLSEIGGASPTMESIEYKGFYIHAAYGEYVKLALFLSKPAPQALKERLVYFLQHFEKHYGDNMLDFQKRGDTSIFDEKKILKKINDLLDV